MFMPDVQNKMKFNKTSATEHVVALKYGYLTKQNWHEKPPDWDDDDIPSF